MSFASNMTATGLRLLTKYGQLTPCHRINVTSFDPDDGTVSLAGRTDYDSYAYPSNYTAQQIDGTLVQQGDILLIMSSTTEPLINDICEVNGYTYTFLNVQKITAQGQNIIYKIQLRQ